jgi:TIR domain-containing protein
VADAVYAGLEARGIRCWMAPRKIRPGADWGAAIIEGIETCKVFVLIFTAHANSSEQIKREVERAVAKGAKLVSVRLEDVPMSKSLEYFLSTPHWLDAIEGPIEDHVAKLAETVQFLAATRDSRQIPPPLKVRHREPVHSAAPPNTVWRRPLVLAAVAAAAFALYYFALRKAPPQIVAINFPPAIGTGARNAVGTVQFQAPHDEIARAEFEVVEAERFEPFSVVPRGVGGQKTGSFSFGLHSGVPQLVTLRATLVDSAGRRSSPVSFSFEVRKAAPGQDRSFEINTPHGFKFKIPG